VCSDRSILLAGLTFVPVLAAFLRQDPAYLVGRSLDLEPPRSHPASLTGHRRAHQPCIPTLHRARTILVERGQIDPIPAPSDVWSSPRRGFAAAYFSSATARAPTARIRPLACERPAQGRSLSRGRGLGRSMHQTGSTAVGKFEIQGRPGPSAARTIIVGRPLVRLREGGGQGMVSCCGLRPCRPVLSG